MKFLIIALLSLLSVSAFAGETEVILGIIAPFLTEYAVKYPLLGDIIGIMVTFRLVMKPLMSALLTIFKDTNISFLSFTTEITEAKWYKTVAFVLDWMLSIKLPKDGPK